MSYPDLWFVVRWIEDDTDDILYDVLSAKNVAVEGQHVYEIEVGSEGKGRYSGSFYPCQDCCKRLLKIDRKPNFNTCNNETPYKLTTLLISMEVATLP